MASDLREADLVRIKPHKVIGIVMDVYVQPQLDKRFVQVLISETINWYPETGCELVQRGSYVVE